MPAVKFDGRDLPPNWELCGDGRSCGGPKDTYPEGSEHKQCLAEQGHCKQNHPACGCHLFKADNRTGHEHDPWVHVADPGALPVPKEDHMDYKCICSKQ